MDASKNFPYPTAEESKFIDEKFGQLFDAIQERTEGGITGVLYQGNKSSMVAKDGEFIITALTNPNVSSPIHELVHVWEHYLTANERNVVNSFAGTEDWTHETSEKFARGFEKYLSEGIAPSLKLQEVFIKFSKWLVDIYNG